MNWRELAWSGNNVRRNRYLDSGIDYWYEWLVLGKSKETTFSDVGAVGLWESNYPRGEAGKSTYYWRQQPTREYCSFIYPFLSTHPSSFPCTFIVQAPKLLMEGREGGGEIPMSASTSLQTCVIAWFRVPRNQGNYLPRMQTFGWKREEQKKIKKNGQMVNATGIHRPQDTKWDFQNDSSAPQALLHYPLCAPRCVSISGIQFSTLDCGSLLAHVRGLLFTPRVSERACKYVETDFF